VSEASEQLALAQLRERLASKYADVPSGLVSAAVHAAHARFAESPIRDFVPLLVERRVRAELASAMAEAQG